MITARHGLAHLIHHAQISDWAESVEIGEDDQDRWVLMVKEYDHDTLHTATWSSLSAAANQWAERMRNNPERAAVATAIQQRDWERLTTADGAGMAGDEIIQIALFGNIVMAPA